MLSRTLINTPLQRGEKGCNNILNRFSGFRFRGQNEVETAKAVQFLHERSDTPLKRGVNETASPAWTLPILPNLGLHYELAGETSRRLLA